MSRKRKVETAAALEEQSTFSRCSLEKEDLSAFKIPKISDDCEEQNKSKIGCVPSWGKGAILRHLGVPVTNKKKKYNLISKSATVKSESTNMAGTSSSRSSKQAEMSSDVEKVTKSPELKRKHAKSSTKLIKSDMKRIFKVATSFCRTKIVSDRDNKTHPIKCVDVKPDPPTERKYLETRPKSSFDQDEKILSMKHASHDVSNASSGAPNSVNVVACPSHEIFYVKHQVNPEKKNLETEPRLSFDNINKVLGVKARSFDVSNRCKKATSSTALCASHESHGHEEEKSKTERKFLETRPKSNLDQIVKVLSMKHASRDVSSRSSGAPNSVKVVACPSHENFYVKHQVNTERKTMETEPQISFDKINKVLGVKAQSFDVSDRFKMATSSMYAANESHGHEEEKYTFFFQKFSPFSQHHACSFVVNGTSYNCTEQYMMHQKAVVFNDKNMVAKIMATSDPVMQKKYGRMVKRFLRTSGIVNVEILSRKPTWPSFPKIKISRKP